MSQMQTVLHDSSNHICWCPERRTSNWFHTSVYCRLELPTSSTDSFKHRRLLASNVLNTLCMPHHTRPASRPKPHALADARLDAGRLAAIAAALLAHLLDLALSADDRLAVLDLVAYPRVFGVLAPVGGQAPVLLNRPIDPAGERQVWLS